MQSENETRLPHIWIDVTSLESSLYGRKRPTGIPRVVTEIALAALRQCPANYEIGLVRFDMVRGVFLRVSQEEFGSGVVSNWHSASRSVSLADRMRATPWGKALGRLRLQRRLTRFKASGSRTISSLAQLLGIRKSKFLHPFENGDTFLNLGIWCQEGVLPALQEMRASGLALKCAVLIHDCMPLLYPEFFPKSERQRWLCNSNLLLQCTDVLFANSANTAKDVRKLFPGLAFKPSMVRFGDPLAPDTEVKFASISELVPEVPYILFVGTIEVRKNHILAARAWRGLSEKLSDLPILVFAGNWGWKIEDLKQQLEDSDYVDGLVRIVVSPSDQLLAELYRGCLFTIYPSLYEGWGLPVRESLSNGKVCLAAKNSSLPEAGGDLAVYFESNSQPDFERKIIELLDIARRREFERSIEEHYRPASWEGCWHDIMSAIDTVR